MLAYQRVLILYRDKSRAVMSDEFRDKLMRDGAVPLVEFGFEAFGLKDEASRKAGKRGDIPTIKIGGQYFVPCAKARRLLGLDLREAA